MSNENGALISSCLMGLGVFVFGLIMEPLLMILGGMMIVSGAVARVAESRRLRLMAVEAEKSSASFCEKVA